MRMSIMSVKSSRVNSRQLCVVLGLGLWAGLALAQAAAAGPATQAQDSKNATLPGGAEALNETFQDWQVACASPQGKKRCVISQTQADTKTKQRLLAVELQPQNKAAVGVLLLPFGLDLDKGVILKAGDAQIGASLRFKTCLPQGCLVPLSFDPKTLEMLHKASALSVFAAADTGQNLSFQVSLKGFKPALSRATLLTE